MRVLNRLLNSNPIVKSNARVYLKNVVLTGRVCFVLDLNVVYNDGIPVKD